MGRASKPVEYAVTPRLCLRVCSHFRRDVEAAVAMLDAVRVEVHPYPPACTLNTGRCELDARLLAGALPDHCDGVLCILGCAPEVSQPSADPRVADLRLGHCMQLLAGRDVLEREIAAGAYLVTAGWLRHWREHLRGLGFDPDTARAFFQECARELLLLDTGQDECAGAELEAMARALGLPYRSRFVGLDHLRVLLDGAIQRWLGARAEAKARDSITQSNRKVADYAMAFDLLVRLSHITDEEATIAAIQELFAMLFGCTNLVYAQVVDGRIGRIFAATEQPEDRTDLQQTLDALQEGYLVVPSGTGFYLQIDYQDEPLGLILVREIHFPAYRDQYLNLGLAIANLCGLAIANARTYRALRETEQNLRLERDINARLFQQVRSLADTDALTKLHNRRRFIELAEAELARAKRYHLPIALIMLDLDGFKAINDTHGHAVGDQVLEQVALRLRGVRGSDILARYGGEEFIALCPSIDLERAGRLAERLRATLSERPIETSAGAIRVTASLGVAVIDRRLTDLDQFIDRADQALYQAKAAGRNRVSMYRDDSAANP